MSYNLQLSNTSPLTILADGTADTTSTSLTLVGKNYPSYGLFLNENFIYLLENFAKATAPLHPLPGQLWWDSNNTLLKVNAAATKDDAAIWKVVSASTSSASKPTNAVTGDLWWDSGNSQLNVYNGSTWILIGPSYTATTGQTTAQAATVNGTDNQQHIILKFIVANQLVAILSKDATFTPNPAITNFSTIKPGLNLSSQTNPAFVYWGDSNSALNLNVAGTLVPASKFIRSDVSVALTQKLPVQSNDGIEIGATAQGKLKISGTEFQVISDAASADLVFYTKTGGVQTKVMTLNGTYGNVILTKDPQTALGAATKQYVDAANTTQDGVISTRISAALSTYLNSNSLDNGNVQLTGNILPTSSNVYALGSSTKFFANVWSSAFRGKSFIGGGADLAEKYLTDQEYPAGTVLAVGGAAELTACMVNQIAIGVVSANPAFIMNEESAGQTVALKGRVPVMIMGPVAKGDGLTAGDFGHAITSYDDANSADGETGLYLQRIFAVSLEDNDNPDSKLVECIIL